MCHIKRKLPISGYEGVEPGYRTNLLLTTLNGSSHPANSHIHTDNENSKVKFADTPYRLSPEMTF
jgi:hypothetical protein